MKESNTTLTMLTGDVRFSENRVTFDNLEGRVGGGTIHVRGTGLIQNNQMEGLNVRIETERVRFRYPAGLRSSVTGTLLVKGTSSEPILDGDLTVDSMTYSKRLRTLPGYFSSLEVSTAEGRLSIGSVSQYMSPATATSRFKTSSQTSAVPE